MLWVIVIAGLLLNGTVWKAYGICLLENRLDIDVLDV